MRPPARTTRTRTSLANETPSPPLPLGSPSIASSIAMPQADGGDMKERRTRRRMSEEQLQLLEALFSDTTHPTREVKETLADRIGM